MLGKDMSLFVCKGAGAATELLDDAQFGAAAAWIDLQLCFTCMTSKAAIMGQQVCWMMRRYSSIYDLCCCVGHIAH